ncbi:MAG: NAD-dependent epimerase/dehydratase family protein [Pseudomonadota bacterium]
MPFEKFTVVGLGWLGRSFAETALQRGHSVYGTVRTKEKAERLATALSTHVTEVDCYSPTPGTDFKTLFEGRIAIINIAAGRRQLDAYSYSNAIANLVTKILEGGAEKLIFVSTTSVFGDHIGKIANQTALSPTTESGRAHATIERFLFDNFDEQTCVLRLAGLVGPNTDTSVENNYRHPIFSLVKRGVVFASNQPVNLIHKDDVIDSLFAAAKTKHAVGALNLCATEHPTKYDYYSWCANKLMLETPRFEKTLGVGRYVDASETLRLLDLTLKYPSPYDMLPD